MQPTPGKSKRVQEIAGVISLIGALYLAVSLLSYDRWDPSLFTFSRVGVNNYGGVVGAYLADIVFSLIGVSGYLIPVFLVLYGIRKIAGKERNTVHIVGALLLLISLSLLFHLIAKSASLLVEPPGGVAGLFLGSLLEGFLSTVGAYIVSAALFLIALILVSPVSLFDSLAAMKREKGRGRRQRGKPLSETPVEDPVEEREIIIHEPAKGEVKIGAPSPPKPEKESPVKEASPAGGYQIPPLDFLRESEGFSGPAKEELNNAAAGLEKKLADFGVSGKIKQAYPGPVVTMYEFEPAAGVKINRIVSLSDDLALALRAPSIRVYPIAGKAAIGIEVPNRQRATVYLKEIFSSEPFRKSSSLLTLALGKDIFGNPVVADLARMPHLLVAGATGSGKSVSVNAMIMSLLYKATPDEVKMLMVDPKLLELSAYGDIPHLISPVITNPKEASEALKKVVYEMERRYRLLAERGARNIDTYNRQASPSERLPYIVVFIDELADLMLTAPADVENAIARLAQMARASGIHLILATQRPSVDVITGLIKANFPARISFQVTSKIDSRTILDSQGAEQLLGMGDMLFMVPGVKMTRIHGAYVSDSEVKAVTDFAKAQKRPDYTPFDSIVVADDQEKGEGDAGERDEMYQRVIEFAESAGEVSISSIQRRFKIGYNRAANLMELLAEDGLVGPPRGAGKPRDFLGRR
ncbi:MAG: DNA translocase FtsK [Alphaproteobacteria bacterium]|uniref:DNA translocase FtsK n=1 Tax=Candidatus Nitrobium versatile TaxID=2884831 RepID=A0A953M2V2_9BACT|nr:DNA translocase FtsK [Candidatus Nitrobium versatile]